MRKRCYTVLIPLLLLFAGRAVGQIDIYLSTEKSGHGKIPIVVTEIERTDGTLRESAVYITRVLEKDLGYSGYFDPVRFEPGSDTLAGAVTAAAIFRGSLQREGERFSLDVRLLDFLSGETIFTKRYRFDTSARRKVAHHICDEITYFLIGERGIATTRLLFCRRSGESKDLYVIDYDGFGERRLTRGELAVSPLWLDNGRLLYTSYKRGTPDCYSIDLGAGKKSLMSSSSFSSSGAGGLQDARFEGSSLLPCEQSSRGYGPLLTAGCVGRSRKPNGSGRDIPILTGL